jgi:hypothetical protein
MDMSGIDRGLAPRGGIFVSLRKPVAAAAVLVVLAANAESTHAQVSRVFVSVNGNDANTCSNVATPCRTLAGGITQVDAQGEVIVIESGSYAGGTIAKSVRINVPAGVVAFSGLPIVVNPGAGGTVVLRGLTLKAATAGTGTGITHNSGALFVENAVVDGWQDGLITNPGAQQLFVKASVFRNQSNNGLYVGGPVMAFVDASFFERNGNNGLYFLTGTARVSNSVMSLNDGSGATAGATAVVTVQRCEVTGNLNNALAAFGGGILTVSQSTIADSNYGLYNSASTVRSYTNNDNDSPNFGTITMVALK